MKRQMDYAKQRKSAILFGFIHTNTMLKKHIPHETGIAILMAAFFLSWAVAGLPALNAALIGS